MIITSATLTARRRQAFLPTGAVVHSQAYPLVCTCQGETVRTGEAAPPPSREIACLFVEDAPHALAERAVALAEDGLCVLWINNTVARAQQAFHAVRGMAREGLATGLIHSRFPTWRREQLEDQWMERLGRGGQRPTGCVLVATQVAEQSVDIDADLLITDLAPTDMLLQRLGRLWRHERRDRPAAEPKVWIVADDLDSVDSADALRDRLGVSRFVYEPYVLWKTHGLWKNLHHLHLPDQVRDLLEATYTDPSPSDPPWTAELHQTMEDRRQILRHKAAALSQGGLPILDDREEVATRYSDRPMATAVLVRACESTGDQASVTLVDGNEVALDRWWRDWWAARAVHRNMVSLPRYPDFKEAQRPPWLEKVVHDRHVVVLQITATGQLVHLDGTPSQYIYNDQLGVQRLDPASDANGQDWIEEDPFDGLDW